MKVLEILLWETKLIIPFFHLKKFQTNGTDFQTIARAARALNISQPIIKAYK